MSRALIDRLGRYFSGVTLASAFVACATYNDSSVHTDAGGSAGTLASAGSAGSFAGGASDPATDAGGGDSADNGGAAGAVSGAPGVSGGGAAGSAGRAGAPAGGAAGSAGMMNRAGASGGGAAGSAGMMNGAGAGGGGAAGTGGVSGTSGVSGTGGASGHAGVAGSGGSGGSNTTATLLSQGKAASADSEQTGNLAPLGNDGVTTTRWCAADGSVNHHWQVDLGALKTLTKVDLTWEKAENYKFLIEGSADGTTYTTLTDQRNTTNASAAQSYALSGAPQARWVRVTVTGLPASNVWASFFECAVYGY